MCITNPLKISDFQGNLLHMLLFLPKHAFYFYKNDEGETIGIVFLKFTGKTCTIAEFSVFEHLKGLGTKLYQAVANLCRERGIYELELWCPFNGSKEFWKKMGFYEKSDSFFYSRISKI